MTTDDKTTSERSRPRKSEMKAAPPATSSWRCGIAADRIPTTFNIYMNVAIAPDGRMTVRPPRPKAGDFIELQAEMDLIVGLMACSAEMSNNYRFKPIDSEIDAS
jgi:uncharacterized protein YcgI (DUF1989 family)